MVVSCTCVDARVDVEKDETTANMAVPTIATANIISIIMNPRWDLAHTTRSRFGVNRCDVNIALTSDSGRKNDLPTVQGVLIP